MPGLDSLGWEHRIAEPSVAGLRAPPEDATRPGLGVLLAFDIGLRLFWSNEQK